MRIRRSVVLLRKGNAYIEYLVAAAAITMAALAFSNSGWVQQLGNQYQGLISQAAQ